MVDAVPRKPRSSVSDTLTELMTRLGPMRSLAAEILASRDHPGPQRAVGVGGKFAASLAV
jgi:hypothetical protein